MVRRIKASPARIWAAITQPDQMLQWWGPDAGPTLSAEADLRPGGRYSIVFCLLDGHQANPTGVYREVIPERKLTFTWDLDDWPDTETLVTFLLEPIEGGTELTLTHEHLPTAPLRDSHQHGWLGWLGQLATFLGDAP
nr:SRPBCC domain-containing protein [Caulobacter sp. SLTY]